MVKNTNGQQNDLETYREQADKESQSTRLAQLSISFLSKAIIVSISSTCRCTVAVAVGISARCGGERDVFTVCDPIAVTCPRKSRGPLLPIPRARLWNYMDTMLRKR